MAKRTERLSDRKCRTAGIGKLLDGGGLMLRVYPSGARAWVLRYMLSGRSREMGLGSFPTVGLAEARGLATKYRAILKAGRDPIEAREAERNAPRTPTFTTVAARYIRAHRRGWRNIRHARTWPRSLKTYAGPIIGAKPVDGVTTEDVLSILNPIWTKKPETASRVQGRMERVLDYATSRGWRSGDNPARWRGHLANMLPTRSKVAPVAHYPAIPYTEVPGFLTELRKLNSASARALEFLILTACRTGEVLGATWEEVDLDARVWTIPAARMKAGREHRVPLSEAATGLLEALPRVGRYVFPGQRYERPLSGMALLMVMRGMGHGVGGEKSSAVPHGFRSAFRDWAGETTAFPRDVVEMALAHTIENKVEAAYRRGDLFVKRATLMQAWADWCTKTPARVVQAIGREATE